jgi:hypothetical protein
MSAALGVVASGEKSISLPYPPESHYYCLLVPRAANANTTHPDNDLGCERPGRGAARMAGLLCVHICAHYARSELAACLLTPCCESSSRLHKFDIDFPWPASLLVLDSDHDPPRLYDGVLLCSL